MLILIHRTCRGPYFNYYGKMLPPLERLKCCFKLPKFRALYHVNFEEKKSRSKLKPKRDIVVKKSPFVLLFKPTDAFKRKQKACIHYLKTFNPTRIDFFIVYPFYEVIDNLYEKSNKIARLVVSLYQDDINLKERCGFVIIFRADKDIDLINFKNKIRSICGFDFYLVSYNDNRHFIGLNSIHIPDIKDMNKDLEILRKFKNDEFNFSKDYPSFKELWD